MPYIVLELVNGSPLRRYLQDSTVSLPTGIFVFGAGVGLVVLVTAGLFLAFRALEARDRAPTAVASDPASAGSQRRSRHDQGERREERGRECDGVAVPVPARPGRRRAVQEHQPGERRVPLQRRCGALSDEDQVRREEPALPQRSQGPAHLRHGQQHFVPAALSRCAQDWRGMLGIFLERRAAERGALRLRHVLRRGPRIQRRQRRKLPGSRSRYGRHRRGASPLLLRGSGTTARTSAAQHVPRVQRAFSSLTSARRRLAVALDLAPRTACSSIRDCAS